LIRRIVMSSSHLASLSLSVLGALALVAACGSSPEPAPDAAPPPPPSTIPTSPAGVFAVASRLDVQVPAPAAPVLAALTAATDGADDPARHLVDCMVATLPDGPVKALAERVAPYLAAYLNARLVDIAPRFVTGIDAMATGLSRLATHLGTIETLRIDAGGAALRTITGLRFDLGAAPIAVTFADAGLPEITVGLRVALDATGQIKLSQHAHRMPYGAMLRLGLERAVVPGVEPGARDLASALGKLVDCARVGGLVAERVGLGSASLYTTACRAGMTAIASEIEARIAAIDDSELGLDVAGTAVGFDADGDGTMDELRTGTWSGSLYSAQARVPVATASFTGREAP
jgi:hypothetical protein